MGEEFSSSDHCIVRFHCNFSSGKVDNKRLTPCFRRINFGVLRGRLAEDRLESVGVVSQWEEFSTKLSSVLHDVIPFVRKKRVCTLHPLWFTDSVRNLSREKKRAFREYKSGRGELSLFTDKRRVLKKAIRDSKKEVESRLADNIDSDPKSFFRYVNNGCKGTDGPFSIGGSRLESNVGMCSAFNDFFVSVFNGDNDIRFTGVAWSNKTLNKTETTLNRY